MSNNRKQTPEQKHRAFWQLMNQISLTREQEKEIDLFAQYANIEVFRIDKRRTKKNWGNE